MGFPFEFVSSSMLNGIRESGKFVLETTELTVNFLNFRTPENFAVIYLKFKRKAQTLGYLVKKMPIE